MLCQLTILAPSARLDMLLERLFQLDRKFAGELEKVLHDEKYVEKLLKLPEKELIELVNYLDDVRSPLAKSI